MVFRFKLKKLTYLISYDMAVSQDTYVLIKATKIPQSLVSALWPPTWKGTSCWWIKTLQTIHQLSSSCLHDPGHSFNIAVCWRYLCQLIYRDNYVISNGLFA